MTGQNPGHSLNLEKAVFTAGFSSREVRAGQGEGQHSNTAPITRCLPHQSVMTFTRYCIQHNPQVGCT